MKIRTFLAVCFWAANLTGASGSLVASEWEGSTNALCRSLIEQRDHALFEDGQKAAVAIISALVRSESLPEAAEKPQLIDVLQRQRNDLATTHAAMVDRSAREPELAAEWHLFLTIGAGEIDLLDRRIEALISGRFEPHRLKRDAATDPQVLEQALFALGFLGRDCELVFSSPGVPPVRAEFINAAARVCAQILDRRAARYLDDTTIIMRSALARGEVDGDRAPLLAAAKALHAEWQQTAEAFRTIDTAAVPDAALWREFLRQLTAIAEGHAARVAALESGDAEQLASAFRPTPLLNVTPEDLGLYQTDCRTVTF
ncbi:hypothetical protein [Devosia submarina]|uniref:hypothetical protein n=1 Tax=Devosia submarina TaxID=1173082 RepID=UPI000D3C6003|nr:hypothetical protein [Devosia submarina]